MTSRIRYLAPRLLIALLVALLTGECAVRLAVALNPNVRYIVADQELGEFATLEQLLETQPFLISHTGRFGYWTNAFGFNDKEFEVPKPPGRTRILALGDSFCYGAVPYPSVVLTLVEEQLGRNSDIDLLNCGLPGQDLSGYRALLQTTVDRFEPDLVVLHVYMGNDGPDFLDEAHSRRFKFYLFRFLSRMTRLLEKKPSPVHPEASPSPGQQVAGGTQVHEGAPELTDQDLSAPRVDDDEFERQLRAELGRFYTTKAAEERWKRVGEELDTIQNLLQARGIPLVLVLYPSRLQLDPSETRKLAEKAGLEAEAVDVEIPNRFFAKSCKERQIPFLDLTETLRSAAKEQGALYVANDTHWNIRGNSVAAEAEGAFLADFLSAKP